MLEKITKLIKYCRNIHEGMDDVPAPLLVATEDQGTLVLNSPKREPRQIVISLPEATLTGDCDNIKGPHTLIIFVLEKAKEQTRTPEQSERLYLETADLLKRLLAKFINASTTATHFTDAETRPDFQILFYPVIKRFRDIIIRTNLQTFDIVLYSSTCG